MLANDNNLGKLLDHIINVYVVKSHSFVSGTNPKGKISSGGNSTKWFLSYVKHFLPIRDYYIREADIASILASNSVDILILPNVIQLSNESIKAITSWVKNGGRLIVLGQTGMKDVNNRTRNYLPLADVLGLTFKSWESKGYVYAFLNFSKPLYYMENKAPINLYFGDGLLDGDLPYGNSVLNATASEATPYALFVDRVGGYFGHAGGNITVGIAYNRYGSGQAFYLNNLFDGIWTSHFTLPGYIFANTNRFNWAFTIWASLIRMLYSDYVIPVIGTLPNGYEMAINIQYHVETSAAYRFMLNIKSVYDQHPWLYNKTQSFIFTSLLVNLSTGQLTSNALNLTNLLKQYGYIGFHTYQLHDWSRKDLQQINQSLIILARYGIMNLPSYGCGPVWTWKDEYVTYASVGVFGGLAFGGGHDKENGFMDYIPYPHLTNQRDLWSTEPLVWGVNGPFSSFSSFSNMFSYYLNLGKMGFGQYTGFIKHDYEFNTSKYKNYHINQLNQFVYFIEPFYYNNTIWIVNSPEFYSWWKNRFNINFTYITFEKQQYIITIDNAHRIKGLTIFLEGSQRIYIVPRDNIIVDGNKIIFKDLIPAGTNTLIMTVSRESNTAILKTMIMPMIITLLIIITIVVIKRSKRHSKM
jgi:hypothetical protein